MKYCYCCKTVKDESSFGKNKAKKDGLSTECKKCKKISDAKSHTQNRPKRLKKMLEYRKIHFVELRQKSIEYSRSDSGRIKNNKATRKYYWKHKKEIASRMHRNQMLQRDKYVARYRASNAIKLGKLIRPNICQDCNKEVFVEMHHPDYSKPFEIIWLCRRCHSIRHRRAETLIG